MIWMIKDLFYGNLTGVGPKLDSIWIGSVLFLHEINISKVHYCDRKERIKGYHIFLRSDAVASKNLSEMIVAGAFCSNVSPSTI